jgi:predicted nucleotide-binding protein (sugar kinase/HSP70/actin superfamily)
MIKFISNKLHEFLNIKVFQHSSAIIYSHFQGVSVFKDKYSITYISVFDMYQLL